MHEKTNTTHTCIPRVTVHLLPSKMGHGMHVKYFGKTKQNKTKDHSPSMTLSELPKKMIKSLKKIAKNT